MQKRSIYDYYFGIFFTFPFIVVGVFLSVLLHHRITRILSFVIIASLLVLNWDGRPFKYAPNNQLGQTKKIARTVLEKTGGKPFNFALITSGNSDHAYRYFFEIWGNAPVTIENMAADPERKTVTDQLLIICEDPGCKPLGHPLWEVAGFGRADITGMWDVPFVRIYRLIHLKEPAA